MIGPEDQASAGYRALQPFGQVPAIETGELTLFDRAPSCCTSPKEAEALMPSDAKDGREPGRGRSRR